MDSPAPTSPALEDIQDRLLDRLHAGELIDREAVLAAHPEHRAALREFFSLLDVIEGPTSTAEAPTPSRLGDFEIQREIGRGGMGIVYAARQISLNRPVALKVLPPRLRQDPRLLQRFQREAEAAGKLRHPHIVPVYTVGEAAGAPFFAMEKVEGRSLAEVVKARREGAGDELPAAGPGWQRWAIELVARVAEALAYAHGRGIVHRDVKPANILLDADGAPRLTDFGLALDEQASGLTRSGEVFGSPLYMSPEQAFRHEQPLDARTDVYSLAVTLYELLTLRLPYRGTSQGDVLAALSTGELTPLRHADPSLSEGLERVLMKALRKDPGERYQDAAAFAVDLRRVLDGENPRASAGPVAAAASAGGLPLPDLPGLPPLPELPAPGIPEAAAGAGHAVGAPHPGWRLLKGVLVALLILSVLGAGCVAVGLLLATGSYVESAHDSGESSDGAFVLPISLTPDELAWMASSDDAETRGLLARWVRTSTTLRSVVSRLEPGQAHFDLTLHLGANHQGEYGLVAQHEARLGDGEWRLIAGDQSILLAGSRGRVQRSDQVSMQTLLGDAITQPVIELYTRTRLRVGRISRAAGGPMFEVLDGGAVVTSAPERHTVSVYDAYPEGYPEVVQDEQLDRRMAGVLTPKRLTSGGVDTTGPSGKSLKITLEYEFVPTAVEWAPCELLLSWPGDDTVIARGTTVFAASPNGALHATSDIKRRSTTLWFELDQADPADEARLLMALETGAVARLRLRSVPSREAALAHPRVDRYWGGSLDVEVPVAPR